MDELDEIMGNTGEVDLSEMFPSTPMTISPPDNSVKNRAALAALVSDNGQDPLSNYNVFMNEAQNGSTEMQDRVINNSVQRAKNTDVQTIMGILSDPSLTFDQKKRAVDSIKMSPIINDVGTNLLSSSVAQASEGENLEQENSRVISTSGAIAEIYESRNRVQGLKNAHGASLKADNTARAVGEMTEAWVIPFANNVISGKIGSAQAEKRGESLGLWGLIKKYALAGSTVNDEREILRSIPPEKRAEFAESFIETIRSNNSITFGNYNQFSQWDKAQAVLEDEGYGDVEKFIDNFAPLLDIVGIGQASRFNRLSKATKTAEKAAVDTAKGVVATEVERAPGARITEADLAKAPTPDMVVRGETPELQELVNQRANLLGDANELDRGTVSKIRDELKTLDSNKPIDNSKVRARQIQKEERISYKDALKKANSEYAEVAADYQATRTRLQSQLDINAQGNKVNQEIAQIDKRIEQLQKQVGELVKPTVNPLLDQIRRIEWNSVVRNENPAAPGNILQTGNPAMGRNFYQSVFRASGDEASEALFATTRQEHLVNQTMPQAITSSGAVQTKIPDVEKNLRKFLQPNEEISEFLANQGGQGLTKAERASARAKVVNDFQNAEGLTVNDAMSGPKFSDDGNFVNVGVVYGTSEGGFLRAEDAIRQAQYALRNYGVSASDIEILGKKGLDHVPVNLSDVAGKDGNYLIRVNVRTELGNQDISDISKLDVKNNIFDRIPQLVWDSKGSVSRWLFDAASMLDKTITGAASHVSDSGARFERILLNIASEYSDRYAKLPKNRKAVIDDYIREANYNEIAFDQTDLIARGFDQFEIETVRKWREFWDSHYYLENLDLVRTFNSSGFGMFRNGNVELYAKPIPKNGNISKVYDPASDTVKFLTKDELDDLYSKNGYYARLRRPTDFNGEIIEHMIVRNTPNEYIRKFKDSDAVLNYRNGYFQLQYIAPKFVDEIVKDTSGRLISRRAVAVAGDTKEAQAFRDRMASNTGKEYVVRDDARAMKVGDDDWFDVNSAQGRIAQRYRGKLLEDGSGLNHLGDGSYILNPVDSAVRSAKSIAGRTVSRPMLENAKARAISQYGEFFPSNNMGGVRWPSSVSEIGQKGVSFSKDIADARTTWEYIHYLENGYINSADDLVKAVFNTIGTKFGELGLSTAERAAYAVSRSNPTTLGKNGVFWAYIGSNFLRQLVVQPHQMIRTAAYNPRGWLSGSVHQLATSYLNAKALKLTTPSKEALEFTKFIDESGFLDAVDKQNLVRGSLYEAASNGNRYLNAAKKVVVELPRKIGFDIGEQANMLGHSAAVYDFYKRAGKDLSQKSVREEAYSEIRAISYDMNFAGDMPYNQTTPAMILQFMQVPHKAVLQLTNRRIDRATKFKLISGDLIMWGPPTALISSALWGDTLNDNPELKDFLTFGAESFFLNKFFDKFVEADTNIDFSSLAPYDLTGWGKFFSTMFENGLTQTMINSPSGQMYLKEGGRVQNAVAAMGRFFGVFDTYDMEQESFTSMMNEVMKISSGYNNAIKARILLNAEKGLNQYGDVIDKKVNHVEAWAQLLGFGTSDTREHYRLAMELNEDDKNYKEDVLKVYKDIRRYYSEKLEVDSNDPKYIQSVTSSILKAFEGKPLAQQIIADQLKKDLSDKETSLLRLMMKRSGFPEMGEAKDQIMRAPVDDATKEELLKRWDHIRNVPDTE